MDDYAEGKADALADHHDEMINHKCGTAAELADFATLVNGASDNYRAGYKDQLVALGYTKEQ